MTWPFINPDGSELRMFGYELIMADPPVDHEMWSDAGKQKHPSRHYETMTDEEICALPIDHLATRDAILWLWTTHAIFPRSLEFIRAWGFKYSTSGVWVKRTKTGKLAFGTGQRLRCASEPFIIAYTGDPLTTKSVRTVIEGPVREHSRKPDEAYREAERLMPRAWRCDLFSRETRKGWSSWGNEAGKFDEGAAPSIPIIRSGEKEKNHEDGNDRNHAGEERGLELAL